MPSLAVAQDSSAASQLRTGVAHLDEVVVTGRSLGELGRQSHLPVQLLAGEELVHRRQGGLGETLAGLPGVHLDSFGGGASRPVIRGQTTPRIEILSDGANLFDVSSTSPDHAITTDPLLLDGIEVLRGPAATRYGGNAMNGAINLIDSRVPNTLPQDGLTGAVEARYGTGDDEQAVVGRVTAGLGAFAVHLEGSLRSAGDYRIHSAHGSDRLTDSFAESSNYGVGASWITSKGYIGAGWSRMESEYGLPGHSHANGVCHTHYYNDYLDLHCRGHGEFVDPITTPDDHTAYIKLISDRADLRADYDNLLPGLAHLRLRASYTDYRHDEFDGPTLFTRYTNEVWDGRVELTHKPLFGFTGTFGVQYTDGTFAGLNINDLAVPFPEDDYGLDGTADYLTGNVAIFLSERRSIGPIDFEIAARKDWRTISASPPPFRSTLPEDNWASEYYGPNWREVLEGFALDSFDQLHPRAEHNPFSASLGATWNIDPAYALALSLAHTERAPSVRELYANGNNLATNSYEMGLTQSPGDWLWDDFPVSFPRSAPDLLEKTRSINLTFTKATGQTRFEISAFHQQIDNYIFARLIDTDSERGAAHNWLLYVAADAEFSGLDGQISHDLNSASRVTLFGDYVRAEMKSENDNLPRIPPGRLGVRYEWSSGPLSADAEYYRTFEQDRVAAYETRTQGFDMLNATVSYRLDVGAERSVDLFLRGTNLTNDLAYVHTSFVKDQSPMRGRNFVFGVRHRF